MIGISHPFEDGTLSVFSDSRVVYTHSLKGESKKHLGLFRKVEGRDSTSVHLPSGEHQLRVHVQSAESSFDELRTIALNLERGQTRTLQISFHGRQKDMRLDIH